MKCIGECYFKGEGVEKDAEKGLGWYRKAAACGDVDAMRNLGNFFEIGVRVMRDIQEAENWYREAAKRGDEGARRRLLEVLNLKR